MVPRQFCAYTLHVNLPEMGEILEREFEKLGIKFKELEEDERVFLYMKKFNVGTLNMLCYKFAVGDLSLDGFMKKFEVKEEKNIEQVLEEETEKGNKRKENRHISFMEKLYNTSSRRSINRRGNFK